MTSDSSTEPVIKVRGKVIKFDKVDPLIQQTELSDQEMLDIMDAAIKALEKGEALTPEQQAMIDQQ
jgi:ribosome assembly protein YihI (activator of Der GTPase)